MNLLMASASSNLTSCNPSDFWVINFRLSTSLLMPLGFYAVRLVGVTHTDHLHIIYQFLEPIPSPGVSFFKPPVLIAIFIPLPVPPGIIDYGQVALIMVDLIK
jgi:hypothetical protein